MQQSFKRYLYTLASTAALLPTLAAAQDNNPVTGPVKSDTFVNGTNASLLPLSISTEDIGRIIFVRGIDYALLIVGVMSVAYIVYSAIQLSTAAGDEAKIEQAKKALIWSVIGTAVAMMAFFIVRATQSSTNTGAF